MVKKKKKYVDVVINIEHDLLFDIMLLAHERDITLNQMIHIALKEYIDKHSS